MEFWCHVCDAVIVDSEKPETGTFYQATGHRVNFAKEEVTSHYETLVFAVCPDCKLKDAVLNAKDLMSTLHD